MSHILLKEIIVTDEGILNKIVNIKSLENNTKILYTKNIEKIDWCRSESHKNHYKQLKEILNILG